MTAPGDTTAFDVDLSDPRTHAEHDLQPLWQRLRREEPISRHPATAKTSPFWVVTRHADALRVYRDSTTFVSTRGNVLDTVARGGDSASGLMLPVSDGPRHLAVRKVVYAALTPRALAGAQHALRAAVDPVILAGIEAGRCDFVSTIAAQIPLVAVCELLGVPQADRGHVLALSSSTLGSADPAQTDTQVREARGELLTYLSGVARSRRRSPGNDPLT